MSSPIIANFGKSRGLPISCNNSVVDDSLYSILTKAAEIGTMSKLGAGTSIYLGNLRERGAKIATGGESSGPCHFAEIYDTLTDVISQSSVRRGACAVYLDVDHPDIMEFLTFRSEGSPIHNLHFGVCISDDFMERVERREYDALEIWVKILEKRFEKGEPFLFFSDTVNNNTVDVYKDKGMKILSSQLCTEIMLPSTSDSSFVCDLSSMNLAYYDEWKTTDAVKTLVYFLDAVMTEYIEKIEGVPYMEAALKFSIEHRALGIGGLGWHSYLQSKMIPFESWDAKRLNVEIWKHIQEESDAASVELALLYGEPELLKGYGRRNTTLRAIAPTQSSSLILGQISPSIEPYDDNYHLKDSAKGGFDFKNPYLEAVLETYGKNDRETWKDILHHGGSVQHLEFLSDREREVFKTFGEISQMEVVVQAAQRQKFIDQGQSLNITVPKGTSAAEVSELYEYGWKVGIKTFYYQHGANPSQKLLRNLTTCAACES